jgi:hypothetical protein
LVFWHSLWSLIYMTLNGFCIDEILRQKKWPCLGGIVLYPTTEHVKVPWEQRWFSFTGYRGWNSC